jgi:hypothetical protein
MGCTVSTDSSVRSDSSTSNRSSHEPFTPAATVDGNTAKSSQSHDSYLRTVSPPGQVATSQRQNSCEQQTAEGNCQRGFLGLLSGSGGDSAITMSIENCATNPLLARPMAVESATSIEDCFSGVLPAPHEHGILQEELEFDESGPHRSACADLPACKFECSDGEDLGPDCGRQFSDKKNVTETGSQEAAVTRVLKVDKNQRLSLQSGAGIYLLPAVIRGSAVDIDVPLPSSHNPSWASLDLTMVPEEDLEWMELHSRERASPGFMAPEPEDPRWWEPHMRMCYALVSAQEEPTPSN